MTIFVKIVPTTTTTTTTTAKSESRHARPKNSMVAVLAYDGVNAFELGLAVEIFGLPNMGRHWYRVVVCAERPGRPIAAAGGITLVADFGLASLRRAGTIIVPGWQNIDRAPPEGLLNALRRAHARGARIASICSGVFVVAAAGLLAGRRATAHWANTEELMRKYPQVQVDPNVLYVDDGNILSSAGRAAGLDLCVHIVRRDFGPEIANDVARRLVIPAHREGGQAQFIPCAVWAEGDPLATLRAWIREHLDHELTIDDLSAKVKMSRRTFIRRFEKAVGVSPGEWVLQERTTRACNLLEATNMSIERVATAAGFGSADALRHHFRNRLGTTPARYRASFRM